jgi:hypothetical protein
MTLTRSARMSAPRKPLAQFSKKRLEALAAQGIDHPASTFTPRTPKLAAAGGIKLPARPAAKAATKRESTDPDPATRDAVLERDMYYCLLCGGGIGDRRGVDYSIHHRKLRSQGGDNSLPNLILLCGSGTTGCHGAVHAKPKWARKFGGWLLKSTDDPAAFPVLIDKADRWVLLTPGGRRVTTSAPVLDEAAA